MRHFFLVILLHFWRFVKSFLGLQMTKWKERRICLCFLLPFHCVLLGPYTNSFPSESGLSLWTAGCALLFLLQKQSRKTSWTNSDSFLFGEQEIEFLIISRLRERLQVPLGNKRKEKNLKWLGAKKWPQTFWIWCQMRPRSRRMKTLPAKAMMEASGIGEIQNKVRHGSRLQVHDFKSNHGRRYGNIIKNSFCSLFWTGVLQTKISYPISQNLRILGNIWVQIYNKI